jgi:hypothetical protein
MTIHPIVGSKYRPPASTILSILPVGQELELVPEPGNEFDENAIAVWIDGSAINTNLELEVVESKFQEAGYTTDTIVSDSWHLGYIPKEVAAGIHLDGPIRGKFCVGSNGGPRIEFQL